MPSYIVQLPQHSIYQTGTVTLTDTVNDASILSLESTQIIGDSFFLDVRQGGVGGPSNVTVSLTGSTVKATYTLTIHGYPAIVNGYVKVFYGDFEDYNPEDSSTPCKHFFLDSSSDKSIMSEYPLCNVDNFSMLPLPFDRVNTTTAPGYHSIWIPTTKSFNDNWIQSYALPGYYRDNNSSIWALDPASVPYFTSDPVFEITTKGAVSIQVVNNTLKVGSISYAKSFFKCGKIPTRLLVIMQGPGGSGAKGTDMNKGGGGGGSGAFAAFILEVSNNIIYLNNGASNESSFVASGSTDNKILTVGSGKNGTSIGGGSGGSVTTTSSSLIHMLLTASGVSGNYYGHPGSDTSSKTITCTYSVVLPEIFSTRYRKAFGNQSGGQVLQTAPGGGGGGASYIAGGGNGGGVTGIASTGYAGVKGSGGGGGYSGYDGGTGGTGYIAIYTC